MGRFVGDGDVGRRVGLRVGDKVLHVTRNDEATFDM